MGAGVVSLNVNMERGISRFQNKIGSVAGIFLRMKCEFQLHELDMDWILGQKAFAMILEAMIQRLYASLVHGPSMNARPHRSRQRCDWMELGILKGLPPESALKTLLEKRKIEFPAKVPSFSAPSYPEAEWSDEQKQARDSYQKQTKLLNKLRDIADDALEFMNDHGESCLALGFPLVSIPPAGDENAVRGSSRILAPLLLMPINLQVRTASRTGVTIECVGEGADLMVANPALIAWLERQTGKSLGDIFLDEEGADPWREVDELLKQVLSLLDLQGSPPFNGETTLTAVPSTEQIPKQTCVLPSAVLGLFPLSNQSLLRDTRWMMENQDSLQEPLSAFLSPKALHDAEDKPAEQEPVTISKRDFKAEWLVSAADPCQANAVLASREAKALVVHGPPGTGKSQTITNMIADHLARGERILFVCDKRTALDVVKYRLDSVGIGDLCGVVHDPSGDRKDFYMGLRDQLENLADTPPLEDPRLSLDAVNSQLSQIHAELESYRQKLHLAPGDNARSFHDLLGDWLKYATRSDLPVVDSLPNLTAADVTSASTTLDEICRRSERASYPSNPFRNKLGISLTDFLARNSSETAKALQGLVVKAEDSERLKPAENVSPYDTNSPLLDQVKTRGEIVELLKCILEAGDLAFAKTVASLSDGRSKDLSRELPDVLAWVSDVEAVPLDRALLSSARSAGLLNLASTNQHLAALSAWEAIHGSFFKKLFAGAVKKAAAAALSPLGLAIDAGWKQGLVFYKGVKSRLQVMDWIGRITGLEVTALSDDNELKSRSFIAKTVWALMASAKPLGITMRLLESLDNADSLSEMKNGFERDASWGASLNELAVEVAKCGLFAEAAQKELLRVWLNSANATEITKDWVTNQSTIEDVVRLQAAVAQLPKDIQGSTEKLVAEGAEYDELRDCYNKQAVENELRARLKQDPELATIDGERIEAAFDAFLKLSSEKPQLVTNYIRFIWRHHQKTRLLSSTGTQLNKLGAGLRQRLYVRGKKALKLRQMLATGAEADGGDPIYDLCPVWMASPSTVAQIFPRHAIFDVVIFDEASQCRLEEALPVLLRGSRVVIAGDQKQLPPTRFFESALADSGDSDAETAEELFYQQQQEAEDLLSAALNIDVREAYLDVHYRSRNEALIGFSNEHYYGSRLQPIPGHPRNKALSTPIQLHRVDGVYAERANLKEAEAAVDLIAEMLAGKQPPSIGVACFNLTQKEAIHDALAARVGKDAEFARRYEEAKKRKGRDSFEGLFVKNLENVQGDERDVMIICTTFGPDEKGKFRRNFGALSQREGGRRLNVLVTRARDAVHVITSIPVSEYTSVETVPTGQLPNGRLQLYAYLRYAESLAKLFEEYQEELEKMRRDTKPEVKTWPSVTPSSVAAAVGASILQKHGAGSHVHWGNEGFCMDVACIHPLMPADVTVGVLTDFSRFHKTPDPIEWDLFRTRVFKAQGWEIERLWSPVLFRRSEEMLQRVVGTHQRIAQSGSKNERLVSADPT